MGVFSHCNVCGVVLRTADEDAMGMCEHCAYDWQREDPPRMRRASRKKDPTADVGDGRPSLSAASSAGK